MINSCFSKTWERLWKKRGLSKEDVYELKVSSLLDTLNMQLDNELSIKVDNSFLEIYLEGLLLKSQCFLFIYNETIYDALIELNFNAIKELDKKITRLKEEMKGMKFSK